MLEENLEKAALFRWEPLDPAEVKGLERSGDEMAMHAATLSATRMILGSTREALKIAIASDAFEGDLLAMLEATATSFESFAAQCKTARACLLAAGAELLLTEQGAKGAFG